MKKFGCIVLSAVILLLSCSLFCSAVNLDDGQYEMPVSILDDNKDKISFGDRFVVHTALVEVVNGQRFVTIVMTNNAEEMDFWYFTNGTAKGDAQKATLVKNVTLADTNYQAGFRFPLMGDQTKVGIKFHAAGMPITPVARISLDYGNMVALTQEEPVEETETIEEETETTEAVVEETTAEEVVEAVEAETTQVQEPELTESVEVPNDQDSSSHLGLFIALAVIVVAVVVAVVILIKKKKK